MYKKNIIKFATIIILTLSVFKSSCQLTNQDSIIIQKFQAVKITDSMNSTIPNDIRIVTIEFFKKHNLNPDEYYFIGAFKPIKGNAQFNNDKNIHEVCYLELQRIGALRSCCPLGAAGGEGDDIWVVYDKDYKNVIYITSVE